jgi:hypothetical protein
MRKDCMCEPENNHLGSHCYAFVTTLSNYKHTVTKLVRDNSIVITMIHVITLTPNGDILTHISAQYDIWDLMDYGALFSQPCTVKKHFLFVTCGVGMLKVMVCYSMFF